MVKAKVKAKSKKAKVEEPDLFSRLGGTNAAKSAAKGGKPEKAVKAAKPEPRPAGKAVPKAAAEPAPAKTPRAAKRHAAGEDDGGDVSVRMAKQQREISISEFFTKNRHLLGFDNPRKSLLTTVKEAVDNSLDACEEAGILPKLLIEIRKVENKDDRFIVIVEDNGPGIQKAQIPKIFGKLLYGSKFHRLKMSRGQQGIGISAAGMYGQLTTGKPVRITSKPSSKKQASYFEISLDTRTNNPEIVKETEVDWDRKHGTRVEIELQGRYHHGKQSVDEYLALTALANPHIAVQYKTPDGQDMKWDNVTNELPFLPQEIKPHPYGVELGMLIKMLKDTEARTLQSFLSSEFSRVSGPLAAEIAKNAGLQPNARPSNVADKGAEDLYKAINATSIRNPSTDCLSPIGDALILKGMQKEIQADFYTSVTRPPAVYRGNPFQIEVGLSFGKPAEEMATGESAEDEAGQGELFEDKKKKKGKNAKDEPPQPESVPEKDDDSEPDQMRVLRFANRVPLLFQQAACSVTKAIIGTEWRNYGLTQSKGALPMGNSVVMVHIASVWVPFTSESKEAVAHYPEILKEIKLAVQECGRQLGVFMRRRAKVADEMRKQEYIKKYIPVIVEALDEIMKLDEKKKKRAVDKLTGILERSRT